MRKNIRKSILATSFLCVALAGGCLLGVKGESVIAASSVQGQTGVATGSAMSAIDRITNITLTNSDVVQ